MQIGYQNDLAYNYLGQSAEGLGSPKAALKFYRIAGARQQDSIQISMATHGVSENIFGTSHPLRVIDRFLIVYTQSELDPSDGEMP